MLWRNRRFQIAECEECRQLFTWPQALEDLYDHRYYERYAAKESTDERVFAMVLNRLTQLQPSGQLLDIGCGIGTFARMAQQRGFSVRGIDRSEAAIHAARQRYPGLSLETGGAEDLPQGCFDVVSILDMLMLVRDPHTVIDAVSRRLRPGGVLAVKAVDRPPRFCRAVGLALFPMRSRGQSLFFLPNALYHFSPGTLASLVENHGFRLLDVLRVSLPGGSPRDLGQRVIQACGALFTRILLSSSHFVSFFQKTP